MKLRLLAVAALTLAVALSGCGRKGDLVPYGEKSEQEKPISRF